MDIEKIFSEMSLEEQEMFKHHSASEYFRYVEEQEPYQTVLQKMENGISLEDDDWKYIMTRMYVVGSIALTEVEKRDLYFWFCNIISKIGMKISKKDRPLYLECLKMAEYCWGVTKEKEMNMDFFRGMDIVLDGDSESELDILLRQCKECAIFRDNKDAYCASYVDHAITYGYIYPQEKMYLHACHASYEREKELVKEYQKSAEKC